MFRAKFGLPARLLLAVALAGLLHTGPAAAATLVVDTIAPGAVTQDLTSLGTTDWRHFGRDSVSTVNRKAGGGDLIGNYKKIGSTPVSRYNANVANRQSVRWSDGRPRTSSSATASGLFFRGLNEGYELTLPADANVRTARVYLGGWKARGRLKVSLSDGSVAPFTTNLGNLTGGFDRAVTIRYSAGSTGQVLRVRFVVQDNSNGGNVTLSAVALAAASVSQPPVLDPIGDQTVRVGQTLTLDVSARDNDGPGPLRLDARPLPGTARFDDLGSGNGRFEWTPQPGDESATPYSVTFSAAENNGAGAVSEEAIGITVQPAEAAGGANDPPVISGQPGGEAEAGSPWAFTPDASDPDGDALSFVIRNRPGWANFDASTGRLAGTPGDSHIGAYSDIRISVTDGQAQTSLPAFAVDVRDRPESTGSAELHWTPPTLRRDGSPLTNLAAYRIYRGTTTGNLTMVRQLSNPGVTSFLMEGLTAGQWHFAISAIDGNGSESALSNVVSRIVN